MESFGKIQDELKKIQKTITSQHVEIKRLRAVAMQQHDVCKEQSDALVKANELLKRRCLDTDREFLELNLEEVINKTKI